MDLPRPNAGSGDIWEALAQMKDLEQTRIITSSGQTSALCKCCPTDDCGKKLTDTQNGELKCEKCQQIYTTYTNAYMTSVEKGRLFDLVRYIHDDPSLVNFTDKDKYTALHRASYGGHLDCAKYLVRHGANVNAQTADGWTPLHCAVRWNNVELVEYLLKEGADVNSRSSGDNTPLHIAASNGRYSLTCDILQMLLFHPDCDITIRNSSGDTAYAIAKRGGPLYRLWSGVMTLE